jgi:hypothetical protein
VIIDAASYSELEPELSMVPRVREAMQSEPSKKFQVMAFGYELSDKKEKGKSKIEGSSFRDPRLLSNPAISVSSRYAPPPPPLPLPSFRAQDQFKVPFEDFTDDENIPEGQSFYQKEDLSDILKVMLSGKVYGFSLGDSTWGKQDTAVQRGALLIEVRHFLSL